MTKIAGSESISQRHGSEDPDPHQNVMDPEHCGKCFLRIKIRGAVYMNDGSGMSINYGPGFYLAKVPIHMEQNKFSNREQMHLVKIPPFLLSCSGSATFWYGSGSADSWIRITDLRTRSGFCSFRLCLSRCLQFYFKFATF
jgi:hypothetical protein